MSRFERSIPAQYFDDLYARDSDPWRFASSDYEREKYAATLAALPHAEYRSVLEVGCSIGILTRQIAARSDAICAVDLAARALDEAKRHCADLDQVRFELMAVPAQWPAGRFDLIVLSEVVYYLDRGDVRALAQRVRGSTATGADIVLVHWTGETHYPLSGDEAADHFAAVAAGWTEKLAETRKEGYRIDVFRAV